jgi:hypothetical protein
MRSTIMIKENTSMDFFNSTVHTIELDDNANGGWYKQITSIEAMIDRSSNRWFYHWHKKHNQTHQSKLRFNRWRNDDEELYLIQRKNLSNTSLELSLKLFPEQNKIHHNSVWNFFHYIKYDHKDKKVRNIDSLIHISDK